MLASGVEERTQHVSPVQGHSSSALHALQQAPIEEENPLPFPFSLEMIDKGDENLTRKCSIDKSTRERKEEVGGF